MPTWECKLLFWMLASLCIEVTSLALATRLYHLLAICFLFIVPFSLRLHLRFPIFFFLEAAGNGPWHKRSEQIMYHERRRLGLAHIPFSLFFYDSYDIA
jgi:hypothetical protein